MNFEFEIIWCFNFGTSANRSFLIKAFDRSKASLGNIISSGTSFLTLFMLVVFIIMTELRNHFFRCLFNPFVIKSFLCIISIDRVYLQKVCNKLFCIFIRYLFETIFFENVFVIKSNHILLIPSSCLGLFKALDHLLFEKFFRVFTFIVGV
jgi:hypothetical protein